MKLSLPANISKLRKEHAMTQEQLAEALGVTFASVSKWERGVATPELNLIAEMADLFGVSFDAIVGFEVQNGRIIALEERIHQLQREKNYDEAITEAEKALIRYPNDFRIVYRCGELYSVAGMEQNNVAYSKKALSLYNRACMLDVASPDAGICLGLPPKHGEQACGRCASVHGVSPSFPIGYRTAKGPGLSVPFYAPYAALVMPREMPHSKKGRTQKRTAFCRYSVFQQASQVGKHGHAALQDALHMGDGDAVVGHGHALVPGAFHPVQHLPGG